MRRVVVASAALTMRRHGGPLLVEVVGDGERGVAHGLDPAGELAPAVAGVGPAGEAAGRVAGLDAEAERLAAGEGCAHGGRSPHQRPAVDREGDTGDEAGLVAADPEQRRRRCRRAVWAPPPSGRGPW